MNDMLQKSKLRLNSSSSGRSEQVFKAWTDQEALRTWMGAGQGLLPRSHDGCTSGRAYVFPMRRPDGTGNAVRGVIKEIVPNRKLRFTWSWDDHDGKPSDVSEVTLEFH